MLDCQALVSLDTVSGNQTRTEGPQWTGGLQSPSNFFVMLVCVNVCLSLNFTFKDGG